MRARIDSVDFATVKAYMRDPRSEIIGVVLVQEGHDLAEVAAFMTEPPQATEDEARDALQQLMDDGTVRFGVDEPRRVHPDLLGYTTLLDTIDDQRTCQVVFLPPFYIVQLSRRQ